MVCDRAKTIIIMILFLVASCRAQESQYIAGRLASADAVVRVKVVEEYGGSAYYHVRAKVIRVFKNRRSQPIESEIGFAYFGSGKGMPIDKECTVYLIGDVNTENRICWSLDESEDSDSTDSYSGFSHVSLSK